jgi:AraC-like DNA-binding protein
LPLQPASGGPPGPMECCRVNWGTLGRVASARGVQIVATNGVPNNRAENLIMTVGGVFSCVMHMAPEAGISRHGQPFQTFGMLNYFAPGISFRLRGGGPFTMSFCVLSPTFLAGLAESEDGIRLDRIEHLPAIESERLTYLGRSMFREAVEPGFASALFAEATGIEIALELARYGDAQRSQDAMHFGGLAPWRMRRLETYIRENLSEELSLNDLAGVAGISVRHLSRVVRQAKGVSVHRWIADCRFLEARRLLIETDLPMNEVARRTAFRSAGAFSTAFRASSGFAPGEFRRLASESS